MTNKLFDRWTWSRSFPEPFDTVSNPVRTDIKSMYNTARTAKSTLYSAVLSAVSADAENRIGIENTCPQPKFAYFFILLWTIERNYGILYL